MAKPKARYRIEKKGNAWQLFLVTWNGDLMWIATRSTESELRNLVGAK